ncbi:MAG: amidohydrolase family protein [Kiritimatiellae bacterium]|nr:amidohydrolase family protein [Kiritimatiellia bacterium]
MIIDAHQHVRWHGWDISDLVEDMSRNKIDVAWVLSCEMPPDEPAWCDGKVVNPAAVRPNGFSPGLPFGDVLAAGHAHPDCFLLGYCPNPRLDDAPDLFESAVRMYGVRICGEWKFRLLLDNPCCLELFRRAGRLGCPVVLHIDVPYLPDGQGGLKYQKMWMGGTVENLERAARACADTKFIGHGPGFWREISGGAETDEAVYPTGPVKPGGRLVRLLDELPNLWADLSGRSGLNALQRDPRHACEFVRRFENKLLFGRDTCGHELQDFLAELALSRPVMRKVLFENARMLAGMPYDAKSRRGKRTKPQTRKGA